MSMSGSSRQSTGESKGVSGALRTPTMNGSSAVVTSGSLVIHGASSARRGGMGGMINGGAPVGADGAVPVGGGGGTGRPVRTDAGVGGGNPGGAGVPPVGNPAGGLPPPVGGGNPVPVVGVPVVVVGLPVPRVRVPLVVSSSLLLRSMLLDTVQRCGIVSRYSPVEPYEYFTPTLGNLKSI